MIGRRDLAIITLACVVAGSFLATPAHSQTAVVSISGGTAVSSIPKGTSANSVLGQADIGFAGGQIWVNGTLNLVEDGVAITLYDVGSESSWQDQIRLANRTSNPITDVDNHGKGSSGSYANGSAPFQLKGTVTQNTGAAGFEFWRLDTDPVVRLVVNGQSPNTAVAGYGASSIALAYLNDANQIVSGPTNRILVILEDGGPDRDYDDYVGILTALPIVP